MKKKTFLNIFLYVTMNHKWKFVETYLGKMYLYVLDIAKFVYFVIEYFILLLYNLFYFIVHVLSMRYKLWFWEEVFFLSMTLKLSILVNNSIEIRIIYFTSYILWYLKFDEINVYL